MGRANRQGSHNSGVKRTGNVLFGKDCDPLLGLCRASGGTAYPNEHGRLAKRLDGFLEFNGNELLTSAGKISAEQAKLHVETEFEKYRITQDRLFMSNFDRYMLELSEAASDTDWWN